MILSFGRHSDLLNLGLEVQRQLEPIASIVPTVYSDRAEVDGQMVEDFGVSACDPKVLAKDIFLNKNNPIIHVVSPTGGGLLCAIAGLISGRKILYHCHRLDFMSFGGTKTLKVFIYTLLVFLISRKVFVHSEKTKKFLIWQSKIVYAELPEYDFSSSNPDFTMVGNEVLFFGRLDGNKGLELFSEIAPLLPDTIFRICGELVDTALESTLGILSKMDNVILNIGRVDQGSLPSIFQKAKCVVLPYSGATQSGIPFLARSLRTPVLVADVGDLAATVSDPMYGASILSRDPEVWSKVIDDTDWHHLRLYIDAVSGRDHVGGVYALVGKEIATGYIK